MAIRIHNTSNGAIAAACATARPSAFEHAKPLPRMAAFALTVVSGSLAAAQATQRVEPVTVSARSAPVLEAENAEVGGFGAPIASTPQSISVIGQDLLRATGSDTLSKAAKLDASLADNYNASGYLESLSVRGFNLTQTANFRRNGLATSNYAPVALENKERIEVLKGVSGLQAGVSAPGGLVNYVTKQPMRERFSALELDVNQRGSTKLHLDHNATFGASGFRVNAAAERIATHTDQASGHRALLAAAFATPLSANLSLAAELELHRKSQPSTPALGLLDKNGDGIAETLPSLTRSLQHLNLNNQAWSLPVESMTSQASASVKHRLSSDWMVSVSASHFVSKLNDRVAFPDGCGSSANFVYPGLCGNGDVDIYDFRSDNETRRLHSIEAKLSGRLALAGADHIPLVSFSRTLSSLRTPPLSAYNYAGTTNIYAPIALPANAALESVNTSSTDRSLDAAFSLHSRWSERLQTYAGFRTSRAERQSVRSDGSEAVTLKQTVTTPWAGMSLQLKDNLSTYISYGLGAEVEYVPNRSTVFSNYGAVLAAAKSKQLEAGLKWQTTPRLLATAAIFSINKPLADDLYAASGPRTRIANAKAARHRGFEAGITGKATDALSIQASATYLDAKLVKSLDPALVGQRATNVPRFAASVFADYKVIAINGLSLNALGLLQSGKAVTSNGSVSLGKSVQLDVGASYRSRVFGQPVTARLHIENTLDRRFWREAPTTSWGGVYLFPSTPRTVRLSISSEF